MTVTRDRSDQATRDNAPAADSGMDARFCDDFVWGVASSAAQTESRRGRGYSNWDALCDERGVVHDGSTNRLCTQFEERYPEDLALLGDAGVKAFRFSIAWPRIQPEGPGPADADGLAFYDRLVDAMLERGITPWPTLFHWDVPTWAGDFRNRDICQRLADYAEIVAGKLGDRIQQWIVLNEPNSVALRGYASEVHAPALNSAEAAFAAIHHQNLAQGLVFRTLRAMLPGQARIGTTVNLQPVRGEAGRVKHAAAAQLVDALWNRTFVDPLYGKGYPQPVDKLVSPFVVDGDMELIDVRPDFLGMNYYSRIYVRQAPGESLGIAQGEPPANLPRTAYFHVEPEGLDEMLLRLHREYDAPEIYVTETGFAMPDPQPRNGVVDDPERIAHLASYLKTAQAAHAQGVRLKGLFYWSATDNWEWAQGFAKRFGLIHVDRQTLARTPKRSLDYFARCIRHNAALDAPS
ncbi:glycosyl hydrolase family protein [Pseudomonas sp. BN417]|uniref:glycoside hydrolase family 1 protein n=1 Tax=Pseudomonas sp. BN417 TaxID=2567890 RepID=UPI002457BA5F|nr:family 1 glycosylhydrolase [Pseudomonas sp. BN417]MDH4557414.1 glycosyl hydrolase family protein [Pseudomonas sp. BN417]